MAGFATLASFLAACTAPDQKQRAARGGNATIGVMSPTNGLALVSSWVSAVTASCKDEHGYGPAAAAPSTATAHTSTDDGSFWHWLDGGSDRYLVDAELLGIPVNIANASAAVSGAVMLIDRLSSSGGLSGNVNTTQTTNLPTAALTRYTDGVGVHAALELATSIGITGTTVTCSYTGSVNGAGQTTQVRPIADVSIRRSAPAFLPLACASGDTGFKSIASVTLAAQTGTPGSIAVVLYRPLVVWPIVPGDEMYWNGLLNGGGNLPNLVSGTCLQIVAVPSDSGTSIDSTHAATALLSVSKAA